MTISTREVDNLRFGAMYTGSWWSVRGMWEKTKAEFNSNVLSSNIDQQKFGLGGTMTFGKTTLLAQWYGTDDASDIIGQQGQPVRSRRVCTACPSARC